MKDELTRYGIEWQGPQLPICKPMADGLWTEWHVANARIEALTAEVERKDAALEAIVKRTAQHPDDDAADDRRDKAKANLIARAALQSQEKVG